MPARMEKNNYGSVPEAVKRRRLALRRGSSIKVYRTFLGDFQESTGASLIILLGFLTALGIGSLIGVIPQVMTQRYAEAVWGYEEDDFLCNSFSSGNKPLQCVRGAEYAQSVASYAAVARYTMALLSNSVAGSYSDRHGRRGLQILSLFFIALSPIAFLLIQVFHNIHPTWFFVAESFSSIIHILSIGFTQLTDVVASRHRAASYGLFFGAFMGGIAVAPFFAAVMSHLNVAIFSCCVRISALLIAVFFLPETLPLEKRTQVAITSGRDDMERIGENNVSLQDKPNGVVHVLFNSMLQPFREMAILRRSKPLMLLASGAFVSKMVFSADITLFFYYVENNLGVTDKDVAGMMFVTGLLGVLVQAVLLKYLISLLGERGLLLASFCSGTIHNLIYGLAPKKWMLYFGLCLSQLSNANNPLLSSMASKCVADSEQGRIQGALFSLTSLAEAIGPVCFNLVYHHYDLVGPGTMFVFGASLYSLGLIAVSFTPPKNTDLNDDDESDADEEKEVLLY